MFAAATGEKRKRDSYLHMNGRRKGSSWGVEGGDMGFYGGGRGPWGENFLFRGLVSRGSGGPWTGDRMPPRPKPPHPNLSPASYRHSQPSVHSPGPKGSLRRQPWALFGSREDQEIWPLMGVGARWVLTSSKVSI